MEEIRKSSTSFLILKWSVFSVFIGRAYQHLFWDAPFRAFFWDEELLKPFIENIIGIQWGDYVSSVSFDLFLKYLTFGFGLLYLVSAGFTLFYNEKNKFHKIVLICASIGLFFLSYLLMKEKFYRVSQFFEYSLQFGIPIIFMFYTKSFFKKNINLILRLLIAIVFVSHGLFAIGYYPVPGHYLGMVINIFDVTESSARQFLFVAGVLDFLLAIFIFVPKLSKTALIYAVFWGLATSFARIIGGFYADFVLESIHLNLYQVVYRLPHGLIPLMLLIKMKEIKKAKLSI